MRFYNYIVEGRKREVDPLLKAEMETLKKQIAHVKAGDPKDPQLKWLRKQLADLRMQSKGVLESTFIAHFDSHVNPSRDRKFYDATSQAVHRGKLEPQEEEEIIRVMSLAGPGTGKTREDTAIELTKKFGVKAGTVVNFWNNWFKIPQNKNIVKMLKSGKRLIGPEVIGKRPQY